MSKSQTLREKILDWFERNPTSKARSGPLAKALKQDQTQVATMLATMIRPGGELVRCKVLVGQSERGSGAREQWEYAMAAGKAPEPVRPYVPPRTAHRPSNPAPIINVANPTSPAGSGANNSGILASEPLAEAPPTEGQDAAPEATVKDPLPVAPAADEMLCCGAAKVMAVTAVEVTGEYRIKVEELESQLRAAQAEIEAKAKRITVLEAEAAYKDGVIADMSQKINSHEEPPAIKANFFAVVRPRKGITRHKTVDVARREAEVGARVDGLAEVYAMVPVSKAVRGAVWEGAKA